MPAQTAMSVVIALGPISLGTGNGNGDRTR